MKSQESFSLFINEMTLFSLQLSSDSSYTEPKEIVNVKMTNLFLFVHAMYDFILQSTRHFKEFKEAPIGFHCVETKPHKKGRVIYWFNLNK